MSEEIKFRFFVPGHGMAFGAIDDLLNHKILITSDGVGKVSGTDSMLKVMRYTGLKDKNGKEVYEGDIITVNIWFGEIKSQSDLPVIFKEGKFGYELYSGSGSYQVMDLLDENEYVEYVVGNIYENPELLK